MGHCGCVGEMEGEEMGGVFGSKKRTEGFYQYFTSFRQHAQ